MTDLCVVAPSHDPDWTLLGDRVFLQAGWSWPNSYLLDGRYTIVDNQHPVSGNIVGSEATRDSILKYIELTASNSGIVDEIIVPDVLQDTQRTIAAAQDFFSLLPSRLYQKSFMVVPQGRNIAEWITCLAILINEYGRRFNVVGVPMLLESWQEGLRNHIVSYIPTKYEVHFLGCWRGTHEMCLRMLSRRVRSWDTSLPISAAQAGCTLRDSSGTYKSHLSDLVVDPHIALDNIEFLKELLH